MVKTDARCSRAALSAREGDAAIPQARDRGYS